MGGMQYLITFDSLEDKQSILESKWLDRWFSSIENINNQSAALWRETWINIHGVPLVAWGYEIFYNIGCIFGKVISVNHMQFDNAKVLIYTDCLFDINCKISMEVDDRKYIIYISEKQQQWGQTLNHNGEVININNKNQSSQFQENSNSFSEDAAEPQQCKSHLSNANGMIEPNNILETCAHKLMQPPKGDKGANDDSMNLDKRDSPS